MRPPAGAGSSGILVRKYGGSSLATVARLAAVAADIRTARDLGYQLVVVVSAMGATTDELADLARQANPEGPRRELDMLLSVGERITMSLLSMALARVGCPAVSLTGSQCGIITDTSHTDAQILEVKGDRVREALARGYTVVVAGFQGVSREREITTLGRGGSDTTAVALAAALGAARCEILKDVDGVMSANPRLVPDARRLQRLSWEQMRQIAASGCGVVHLRAVEYAAKHEVPLVVRSSFHDGPGTVVGPEEPAAGPPPVRTPAPVPADRRPPARRYRPLVLHVDHDVVDVRLETPDPDVFDLWRSTLVERVDPCTVIAEWLDTGAGCRWEALLRGGDARSLVRELQAEGAESGAAVVTHREGLTCLSLAGGRPDSWLEVHRHLSGVMAGLDCPPWRLRADGAALRIVLERRPSQELPARLHAALLAD